MGVIDFIYTISNSPESDIVKMLGYTVFVMWLWVIIIAGFTQGENYYFVSRLRYLLISGAIYHTFIAAWAALQSVGIMIPQEDFGVLTMITTSAMLVSGAHAAIGIHWENRK